MKPISNYENVQDFSEVSRLPAGPQKCQILKVTDYPDKEYLAFEFDIVDGPFKGYFKSLAANNTDGKWPAHGTFIRSYKESALGFFKGTITAIEKTNAGYNFLATNWNEKTLEKKWVVVNFREEEYADENGEVKVSTKPYEFRSVQSLKEGKIKVPEIKRLEKSNMGMGAADNPPPPSDFESPF